MDAPGTPAAYKYKLSVGASIKYGDDVASIRLILQKMLDAGVNPYDKKIYDNDTELFVDTLLYSPDQCRMVVFVVDKNSSNKLSSRESDAPFFYNAHYLFCSRRSELDSIRVYDYTNFRLANFYDFLDIRDALRSYCFTQLTGIDGAEKFYNVDDIRFWNSEIFERVLKHSGSIVL
jgi:hypothetical protein